jgi:hypothetical protein
MSLLVLWLFLLLDDLHKLFFGFWSFRCTSWGLEFELQTVLFVVNGLIKGEIEKPSGQYLGFIFDESLTHRGLNLNPRHFCGSAILPLFVWRIMFACLVVCNWQV